MNAMDRIHHVEHRRPSRRDGRFERAWGGARRDDTPVAAPDPSRERATHRDDVAD